MPIKASHELANTVSSLTLFIGIPTQEHRTVQGTITRLIGDVLKIPHQVRQNQQGTRYEPLVKGASAYSSVFGHWVSNHDYGSRVDDHSEVVQFFTAPYEYHPSLLLILCEIAFPALLVANQESILLLLSHEGVAHRVMLWRQLPQEVPEAPPRTLVESELLIDEKKVDEFPLKYLKFLLSLLIRSEFTDEDLVKECSTLEWFGIKFGGNALYEGLFEGWNEWLNYHCEREPSPVDPDPKDYIPTIYIRILIDFSCWWLFYGTSQTLKRKAGYLWEVPTARKVVSLLQKELDRLDKRWNLWPSILDGTQSNPRLSENPFTNAMLWLAFVHDFIAHSVSCLTFQGAEEADEEIDLHNRKDSAFPDTNHDTAESNSAFSFNPRFDDLASRVFHGSLKFKAERNGYRNPDYWWRRLDLLRKLNDKYFPDDHLIHAWSLLFHLTRHPIIALDTRALMPCPALPRHNRERGYDAGYSVGWASWLGDLSKGPDNWVRLGRMVRDSSPIARMWLAPLITEAMYKGMKGRRAKKDLSKANLKKFIETNPALKQVAGIIERIAGDAAAGFPLDMTQGSDKEPLSAFIAWLQSSKR